jgi:hypothetical protein
MRNIRRDVVEARIDRHRDSEYEHKLQRLPFQPGIYFSVASMALCMWLLHPSTSFLAIICCSASISFVAVVLA